MYTLTATGNAGVTATAQVQISIGLPTVKRFVVTNPPNGTRIYAGTPVQLDWQADGACLSSRQDGMTTVTASRAGRLDLRFHVSPGRALATAVAGAQSRVCDEH